MRGSSRLTLSLVLMAGLFPGFSPTLAEAQPTELTYQGHLQTSGDPASGNHDFQFALFDAVSAGNQLGSTVSRNAVNVADGVFSVVLDFGDAFPGADRFLEIRVRQSGQAQFTVLAPRQPFTSTPYAIRSLSAGTADLLNGIEAGEFILTTDSRLSDARTPLPGSFSYVQNQNSGPQASSNVYIDGTGRASVFEAAGEFRLSGFRVLKADPITYNLFVGNGGTPTTQSFNTFLGFDAGFKNNDGANNAFLGDSAGWNNVGGDQNTFVGSQAGTQNSNGSGNTVLGYQASVGSGIDNATAIGRRSLVTQSNSLVLGSINGINGADADTNVGIGTIAPLARLDVRGNIFVGLTEIPTGGVAENAVYFKDPASSEGNRFYITSTVNHLRLVAGSSNTGTETSIVFATAMPGQLYKDQMVLAGNGNLGIGYSSPPARLSVSGGGFGGNVLIEDGNNNATTLDIQNSSTGGETWRFQSVGSGVSNRIGNLEIWNVGGPVVMSAATTGNVGIGTTVPNARLHVSENSGNVLIGNPDCNPGFAAIGFGLPFTCSNYSLLGDGNDTMVNVPSGGTIMFRIANLTVAAIQPSGRLVLPNLGISGTTTLCHNASDQIATCSSSARYKSDIERFEPGLDVIERLHPVAFNWIDGNMRDFGLVAEDVAKVEPLLVTHNDNGEIEGVKYERVSVVLVNAVNEQQRQIEAEMKEIAEMKTVVKSQQATIALLTAALCRVSPNEGVCSSGT